MLVEMKVIWAAEIGRLRLMQPGLRRPAGNTLRLFGPKEQDAVTEITQKCD